jgi:preprotein translocase subunit SecE
MAYKQDQGRLARMAAFWALALLVLYGCRSLYITLPGWWEKLGTPLIDSVKKLPLLSLNLNWSLVIATLVLAAAWIALYRWQQTPKVADLLIDTETELTKVTWPTVSDAVNSSLVVVGVVLFLMAFLAGMDAMLGWWTTRVLIGK